MNLSRNASDYNYDPESHAGSRKRERRIPIEAVDQAIEEGDAKKGKKNRVNFEAKWSGATFTVVVNPNSNYVVTTFWGTSKTGKALEKAQEKERQRQEAIENLNGAAYTGGWR